MNIKLILSAATVLALCPMLHAQTPPVAPALPFPPAAPAAAPVTLRYKFAVGQVHRYEYDTQTNLVMQTGQTGAGIPMDMTMHMVIRQTVRSVRPADGAATVVTQIESMHMLHGGQEVPLPEDMQAKMKQPSTQVLSPTGDVLSFKASPLAGLPPGMDISKGAFGNLGSTVALPKTPVKTGDTWNSAGTVPTFGIEMATKSTLASFGQKNGETLATIQNTQSGAMNKSATESMAMAMQGTVTGEVSQVFNVSQGALESMAGTTGTDMTMIAKSVAGAASTGMPSAMKMQVQMKYTMTRLSDTSPAATAPVQ